jgi:hypothetical protein
MCEKKKYAFNFETFLFEFGMGRKLAMKRAFEIIKL